MSYSPNEIKQLIAVIEQVSTFTRADSKENEVQYEKALKFLLDRGIKTSIDAIVAADIEYDNSTSGLTATQLQSATDELKSSIDILNNYEKLVTYHEVVSGASSGNQVNVPTGGTITLDRFGESKDSILSSVDGSGNITYQSPKNTGGEIVTSSLDASGNYVFSSTPKEAQVAIVYMFKIKVSDWSNVDLDKVIQESENREDTVFADMWAANTLMNC